MAYDFNHLRSQVQGSKPRGDLILWGEYFGGRPGESRQLMTDVEVAEGNILKFHFEHDEALSVWEPEGLVVTQWTFVIKDAQKILWQWYYYGRPATPDNLRFMKYEHMNGVILVSESEIESGATQTRTLKPGRHSAVVLQY